MQIHHHKFSWTFLFLALGLMINSSCASSKFRLGNKPLVKYFETNPTFRESHTGLLVCDPYTDKILFDYNSHKHFTPASNTKLITYLASIQMMGDSIPAIEYCTVNDTLYFTGTGDPTLLNENFGYSTTADFLKQLSYPLVYIEKSMKDWRFGPGWAWDDYPYYYSPEKCSLPIYGNVVRFNKSDTTNSLQILPDFFRDKVSIKLDSSLEDYRIDREEKSNQFTVYIPHDTTTVSEMVPFHIDAMLNLILLSDTIGHKISQGTKFPDCSKKYLFSVPVDSVTKYILMDSDNFLAEQMLLVISDQLGDTLSSQKVIDYMMENYLSELKDEINWIDGSGLSRYNQVTPNAMVAILKKIYQTVPKEKLFELLPISGKHGTLETSFTNLSGKIHAKTGSMSHVYNLSGYLETNSGRILLFSFMNNNFTFSFQDLKREMERVLSVFLNDY